MSRTGDESGDGKAEEVCGDRNKEWPSRMGDEYESGEEGPQREEDLGRGEEEYRGHKGTRRGLILWIISMNRALWFSERKSIFPKQNISGVENLFSL